MNKSIKTLFFVFLTLLLALTATACAEGTPYDEYDAEGFNVSVKYDANGGMFGDANVTTIVDSYKLSDLPSNSNGKKEIALLSPSDERRGSGNAFLAENSGYFLAGWYTERTPVVNDKGEQLDADGNVASVSGKAPAYNYAGRWDFDNDRYELDGNAQYTSKEAVVTLYAAWIPNFKFEFYSVSTGEKLSEVIFDPNYVSELAVPSWNKQTGKLSMEKFPTVDGKTFNGVYLDKAMSVPVEAATVKHSGSYNAESATANDPVMKLYLDYIDGEWFHIYTAEQFIANSSVRGCYEICADLDFTGLNWKSSLTTAVFRGTINGNGHTFGNITVKQSDVAKQTFGLFGQISAEASITDLTFDNVTAVIEKGARVQDVSYGLLAGKLDSGATLSGLKITASKLLISSDALIDMSKTDIGLLCGIGNIGGFDISGITCGSTGSAPESISVTANGNTVTVTRN